MEAAAQLDCCARIPGLLGEPLDERAALDDEVRALQRDRGSAAISEKLKAADFVEHATFGSATQKIAHVRCDDERSLGMVERFNAFEDANGHSLASKQRRGKQTCCGATDDGDCLSLSGCSR